MSSCSTSKQKATKVVSKYFNDHKSGMDESITEFQEPKKNIRGPKSSHTAKAAPKTGNTTKSAAKPRKKSQKKIKGQKDIKSAFQKNDIVEFTEDFNRICAQSGVDVDAEQLQLAIALSKSLHNAENNKNVKTDDPIPTTSQQRSGKVRSTLLEYGFKVPEVKIDNKSSRRLNKYKKNSLLLLKSEEEKRQNIADKYSQIIFDSLGNEHKNYEDNDDINEFSPIYNKATNTKYEELRNNKYFYIEDLIEVSTEPIGSLLKDWSNIPGRPKSPVSKPNKSIQVCKLKLSDKEIDILLSGKLVDAQKMVFEKSEVMVCETQEVKDEQSEDCDSDIAAANKDTEEESLASNFMNDLRYPRTSKELVFRVRSPSPDLFDDDVSVEVDDDVIEANDLDKINILSNIKESSNLPNVNTQAMDFIDCINKKSFQESSTRTNIIDTEDIVVSDEISKELMKVSNSTDTVQDNSGNSNEEQIDLTQNSDQENDVTIVRDCKNNDNLIVMDSSETEDDDTLPYVEISGHKAYAEISGRKPLDCLNETQRNSNVSKSEEPSLIILDEDDINNDKKEKNETEGTDKSGKSSIASNFEEYSHSHSDDGNLKQTIDLTKIEANRNTLINVNRSPDIDLTQSPNSLEKDNSTNTFSNINRSQEIDLTQSYSSPTETDNPEIFKVSNSTVLETNDGVSAIYDAIVPEFEYHYDNNCAEIDVSITETVGTPKILKNTSNLSQNMDSSQKTINTDAESEVFEISDEELNYSVHNSKYNLSQDNIYVPQDNISVPQDNISEPEYESPNFDLGGLSVINNLSSAHNSVNKSKTFINESYEAKNKENESRNNSFLPVIEIAGTKLKSPKKVETPIVKFNIDQGPSNNFVNNTPKINGFILKTSEVTPLVDYASLTTPERNKELDKYGLKPFKRKRAIQLLTHLYNQTHPIVEVTNDIDLSGSPAKKRKPDPSISTKSPKPTSPTKSPLVRGSTSTGYNSAPSNSQRSPNKPVTPRKCPMLQSSSFTGDKSRPSNSQRSPRKCPISQGSTVTGVNNVEKPRVSSSQRSPRKPLTLRKSPILQGSSSTGISDVRYEVSNFPSLNEVECCPDDWVFQKREKAKLHSCRVPLHIAFHNYVSSCQSLRDTILRYEPVNIDVIHRDLVAFGHRYDPKDLLKYLDKKCITVKTADNSTRNEKKSRQQL